MRLTTRVLLATSVLLLACGGDSATSVTTNPSAVGTWSLSTINGAGMPYLVVGSGTAKQEITAGSLSIIGGGSYTASLTLRTTANGAVSTSSVADAGTYTISGTAITLRSTADGSTISGSVGATTLTLTETGGAYVFTR